MDLCWRRRIALAVTMVTVSTGCGGSPDPGPAGRSSSSSGAALFVDRARESGLDFSYWNGMTGRYYLLEVMGGGAALFDYDNDGDLDLYVVQGARLADGREPLASPPQPVADRLFRNDLTMSGASELRFTDVTEESAVRGLGYGMGVTTGDYDNDGWIDLYVTNWGANQLWRNNGAAADGRVTFTDVTDVTGAGDDRWSVAAVFLDYDRDGWLDLYVGNYVDFSLETHKVCIGFGATEDYCGPAAYPAQSDRLLRNNGAGEEAVTFTDATTAVGFHRRRAPALGAVAADFDGDSWPDLYVANDQAENLLWINRGGRGFDNQALLAGCAVSGQGQAEASMGVAAADFDGDGDFDLFLTHLTGESNTLYLNDGTGGFDDATIRAGLEAASWGVTGFGTAAVDFDRDGWLDLVAVNGAVHRIEELHRRGETYPLQQPNQLFRNLGGGTFQAVGERAGPAFHLGEVSRGVASGDLDNDGDTDLVLVNSNGPLRLLRNETRPRHWLGLRLLDRQTGRDALGATVGLHLPARHPLWRRVHTDGSYASARDPRVLFGLGEASAVTFVEVRWPDGSAEIWQEIAIDRYVTLRQGTGEPR